MCMVEGADDYVEHQHTVFVKCARKEHHCAECGRIIAKGERYRRDEAVMEGSWYTYHTCEHCQIACNWLAEQCGGYLWQGVLEDIQEHVSVYRIARLCRIEIGMKRGWKKFNGTGLMPIPAMPKVVAHKEAA